MYGQQTTHESGLTTNLQAPFLFQFLPKLHPSVGSYIIFPAEEISHGRDITVDALYITISGQPGTTVKFNISGYQKDPDTGVSMFNAGAFTGTVILDPDANIDNVSEYQVFDDATGEAITVKAPQLTMSVPNQTISLPPNKYPYDSNPDFKCSKISMFGSFDPNQRPV